jgi:hypothetical protein
MIKYVRLRCENCNKEITRKPAELLKVKNNFCSYSCSAKYNNKRTKIIQCDKCLLEYKVNLHSNNLCNNCKKLCRKKKKL